jgi:tripartite-type tricarboxylate transporter receptor subunit TctC
MRRTTLLAAALILAGTNAYAQTEFPSRPITMIVPFAAGGPTDTVGRLIAEPMTRMLGQQVLVENVGGAGGTLGAARVAKSDPDGHTILLYHIGQATSVSLYRKLPYDPAKDFTPVGRVTDVPMTLVARPTMEAASAGDLLGYITKNKEDVTLVNAGVGSASHLCGMVLMKALGVPMTTIPYKGTAPAMTDLIGGRVDVMCDQSTNTSGQIKSGNIKAYGVTVNKRLGSLPDLPTLAESGLDGFEVSIWHGIWAPKGTPAAAVSKLEAALQAALKDPNVVKRFADLGTEPVPLDQATPAALDSHLKAEIERWKPIVQAAGVFAD